MQHVSVLWSPQRSNQSLKTTYREHSSEEVPSPERYRICLDEFVRAVDIIETEVQGNEGNSIA